MRLILLMKLLYKKSFYSYDIHVGRKKGKNMNLHHKLTMRLFISIFSSSIYTNAIQLRHTVAVAMVSAPIVARFVLWPCSTICSDCTRSMRVSCCRCASLSLGFINSMIRCVCLQHVDGGDTVCSGGAVRPGPYWTHANHVETQTDKEWGKEKYSLFVKITKFNCKLMLT